MKVYTLKDIAKLKESTAQEIIDYLQSRGYTFAKSPEQPLTLSEIKLIDPIVYFKLKNEPRTHRPQTTLAEEKTEVVFKTPNTDIESPKGMKLIKACRYFNQSMATIVEFLALSGMPILLDPSSRLTNEQYDVLKSQYGKSNFGRNIFYKEEKHFIGIVKFFDVNKDFGFIASNNCNMPDSNYYQDFFVDSKSFIENEAKEEGRIVVFQVERQENEKKRAVNVRQITHLDEDVQLALSYYGEHEYIDYKNHRKINLYAHTFKPLGLVAKKVRYIIEHDPERNPENTAKHFKFFVDHYKKENYSNGTYIFDRSFFTEEKAIWESLLSIFTSKECLAILDIFPSIVKYFNNISLVRHWIEHKLSNTCSLSDIQEIVNTYAFIPQECVDYSKARIEQIADASIKDLLQKLSERSDISKNDMDGISERVSTGGEYNSEKNKLLDDLHSYLHLSSKNYEKEIAKCFTLVKTNHFRKVLSTYVENGYSNNGRAHFFTYLNDLSSEDIHFFKEELISSISPVLDKAIDNKEYRLVIGDLRQLSVIGEDFLKPFKQKLFPLIKETLTVSLRTNLNSPHKIESVLSTLEYYGSIYEKEEKKEIKNVLTHILRETHSIDVLSELSIGIHKWFSMDEALSLSRQIVSQWSFENIKEFLTGKTDLFDRKQPNFADIVIARAKELVGTIPLCHFFDGTPLKEEETNYYSRNPKRENCAFLNDLKRLIPKGYHSSEWDDYINSKSADDLLILFEYDVITSIPDYIIEMIINTISLNDVYADKTQWYYEPALKNFTYVKVLRTTKVNLFPFIAKRLQTMEMTNENVALAVLLTELMTINMPSNDRDYYTHRDWENRFTYQIQNFWKLNAINPRLSVILWAIHSKTRTFSAALTEVFSELPPYLQIRIVKKLFKIISEGKITHTAESLYNLLKDGHKHIFFPLELTFAYLMLREKDPSKTLDNNIMLQLLKDREDTDEWIGIRSLMTQCSGRWITNELPEDKRNLVRNRYFNGTISPIQNDKLRVFIPKKMVDEFGRIKDYNNKNYAHAIRLIQMTYKEHEYQVINEEVGVSYHFDKTYEAELFALARSFNFEFNGLNNSLGFDTRAEDQEDFCECRLSDKVDKHHGIAFYWCGNKPCFRPPVRYHTEDEWEHYTILDFMRILGISPDYINNNGKQTKFGHYIILSSYLKSFAKFYKHLKCRECGKLLKPSDITNFTARAVTEFVCTNDNCLKKGSLVYLNHCFNKQKCNATIDSRDSKQCPYNQYICPECGACCSTENFRMRISHLHMNGGYISNRLRLFVENNLGHWEKQENFCFKCGKPMTEEGGTYKCMDCDVLYDKR